MKNESQASAIQQYLTFQIGGEEYAIGILQVREIIEYGKVTRVPNTPACVRGVINLRGSVLPVIDPSVKFGLPPNEPTKQTCIVVVETSAEEGALVIGVIADAVNQVIELPEDQIQAPPSFGTRVQLDFLRGLTEVDGHFALILDLNRLLTTEELLNMELEDSQAMPSEGVPDASANEAEANSLAAGAGQ
jgi:purine-binding chemotaxis protein CheW